MTYRYPNSRWNINSHKIKIITQYPRTIAYDYFFTYSGALRFLETRRAFSINITFLGYKICTNLVCDISLSTLGSYSKAIKIRLTYFFYCYFLLYLMRNKLLLIPVRILFSRIFFLFTL